MQVMGISIQPEREVVMILVKHADRRKIMQAILEKTTLIEEGRGICFSMPVTKVYGLTRAERHKKQQIKTAEKLKAQASTKDKKEKKDK
jgi:nitrogen regulatory protein PII